MTPELKNRIAQELDTAPELLTSQTVLATLERWDSVAALTLMVVLGDHLGAPVAPEQIAALKTFGDIEALAQKSL
jgi:acyl carrier protein